MKMNYRRLFKYLALVARAIGLFPILIILSYLSFWEYDKSLFWIQLGSTIMIAVLGYFGVCFQSEVTDRFEKKKWLMWLIVVGLYLIEVLCILTGVWNYLPTNMTMKIISSIVYLVLFGLSISAYEHHYTRVLSTEMVILTSSLYLIAMLFSHYSFLGMLYIAVVASYIFLNNQVKLEILLESTQENTPMFQNIRKDNMKRVCLGMGVIFLGYPLRAQIGKILWWIGAKIVALISIIIHLVGSVVSVLIPEPVELEAEKRTVWVQEPAETNEWLDRIFWLVLICVIIYIVIRNRKAIIKALINGLLPIKNSWKQLWAFLFGKREKELQDNEFYEDCIEEVNENMLQMSKSIKSISKRNWHKQVKKYIKKANQRELYRNGYQLLLQGVHFSGIVVKPFHTPREVMLEVEQKLRPIVIEEETTTYEKVRYAEKMAEMEELEKLKSMLKVLLEMNK